jgi:hypothetical protein
MAFNLVKIPDVPVGASIISSHVVYKWKAEDSLKARIVPHGHRDVEKQFLCSNNVCRRFKVVFSIAVKNNRK